MLDLGIYHYNARFYSPALGRFLSADTVVPGAAQSQAYDRYAYVMNSPLVYSDPSGHNLWDNVNDFLSGFVSEVLVTNFGFIPEVQRSLDVNVSESDASIAGRIAGDVFWIVEGFAGVVLGSGTGIGGAILTGPETMGLGAVASIGAGVVVVGAGSAVAINGGANLGQSLALMSGRGKTKGFSFQRAGHARDVLTKGYHINYDDMELSIFANPDGKGGYTWKVTTVGGDSVTNRVAEGAVQFLKDNPEKAIEIANGIISNYSWNLQYSDRVIQAQNIIKALSQ